MLVAICALALVAPLVYPGDPFAIVGKPFAPPFGANLLGTDQLGRDVAAGIARGAEAARSTVDWMTRLS